MAEKTRLEDGTTVWRGKPRKNRGKTLVHTFVEVAQSLDKEQRTLRTTESGQSFFGMICPGFPWVFWSSDKDLLGCERCGATHGTPTAVDPIELFKKYLGPFSTEHKTCTIKEIVS